MKLGNFQRAQHLLGGIRDNRTRGASELTRQALEAIRLAGQGLLASGGASRQQARRLLLLLRAAQPSMAPLLNLAAEGLELLEENPSPEKMGQALLGLVKRWEAQLAGAAESIASALFPLLEGTSHWVTYSRSGTLLVVFGHLRRRGLHGRISISRGEPKGEGSSAARLLAGMGYRVTFTSDAALFSELEGADALLLGADAVLKEGVVNKIGTCALACVARNFKVPVYVACGQDKFLPESQRGCFRMEPRRTRTGSSNSAPAPKRFRLHNPRFDITPHRFITRIISPAA